MKKRRIWGLGILEALVILGIIAVLASIIVPNYLRARSRRKLMACQSTLKNIGAAVEMYSTDWQGQYPETLGVLTPNYLKTLPICPSAEADTYSGSYKRSDGGSIRVVCPSHWRDSSKECYARREALALSLSESAVQTDLSDRPDEGTHCPESGGLAYVQSTQEYSFFCQGNNHERSGFAQDYPRYDGSMGLIQR